MEGCLPTEGSCDTKARSKSPQTHSLVQCSAEDITRSLVVATGSSALSLGTAELASLEHGVGGVLDVLLGGHAHHEARDVHHLLANSDVALADQDAGVVHGAGELALNHEGLEAALKELANGETEHVIELALRLGEETETHETTEEGLAY